MASNFMEGPDHIFKNMMKQKAVIVLCGSLIPDFNDIRK